LSAKKTEEGQRRVSQHKTVSGSVVSIQNYNNNKIKINK